MYFSKSCIIFCSFTESLFPRYILKDSFTSPSLPPFLLPFSLSVIVSVCNSNLWQFSCLSLTNASIVGVSHHHHFCLYCFDTGLYYVSLTDLELTKQTRVASNFSRDILLPLPLSSAGVEGLTTMSTLKFQLLFFFFAQIFLDLTRGSQNPLFFKNLILWCNKTFQGLGSSCNLVSPEIKHFFKISQLFNWKHVQKSHMGVNVFSFKGRL